VLGIVRLKTGSLWSPLLMHSVWNLVGMVETALYVSGAMS
jgi:membrane protease YdiL (CAAX protease family)